MYLSPNQNCHHVEESKVTYDEGCSTNQSSGGPTMSFDWISHPVKKCHWFKWTTVRSTGCRHLPASAFAELYFPLFIYPLLLLSMLVAYCLETRRSSLQQCAYSR